MLSYLGARAIPGGGGGARRPVTGGPSCCRTGRGSCPSLRNRGYVDCELQLEDLRDLTAAVQRCRRLLDLDADPEAVTGYLSADPVIGPLALANPGRRSPGHVDGKRAGALRAVLGQQVSVAAAPAARGRVLVATYGKPLSRPDGPLTAPASPRPGTLAAADPATPAHAARPGPGPGPGWPALFASGELSLDPGGRTGTGPKPCSWRCPESARGPPPTSGMRARLSDPGRVSCRRTWASCLTRWPRPGRRTGRGPVPAARARAAKAAAAAGGKNWRPWRSYGRPPPVGRT